MSDNNDYTLLYKILALGAAFYMYINIYLCRYIIYMQPLTHEQASDVHGIDFASKIDIFELRNKRHRPNVSVLKGHLSDFYSI